MSPENLNISAFNLLIWSGRSSNDMLIGVIVYAMEKKYLSVMWQ